MRRRGLTVLLPLLLAACATGPASRPTPPTPTPIPLPAPTVTLGENGRPCDPVAPERPETTRPPEPIVTVASFADLQRELAARRSWFVATGPIVITEPLHMETWIPGSFVEIDARAGWVGTEFVRGFCSPDALITFGQASDRRRDWEITLRGINFVPMANCPEQGPALSIPYAQLSTFENLRFADFPGVPFRIGSESIGESAFLNVQLLSNGADAEILNAAGVLWSRGAVENHDDRRGGLLIQGRPRERPNSYAGPVFIEHLHQEFSTVRLVSVDSAALLGGSYFQSKIIASDAKGFTFFGGGWWAESELTVNGVPATTCKVQK